MIASCHRGLPTIAMSVGVMVVALIVATLVHELGHAVAGYAAGLRVARVQLGPIEIRDYGRPYVRLVWSLQAGVVLVPFDRSATLGPLRWGLIVSTAAGPLIGLVSGAVILGLAGGLRFGDSLSVPQAVGQMSLILGVLNLLPLRSGEQLADGRRIFSLLLRNRESGQILASTLMLVEALSDRRPRDWDPALLAIMERSPDEVFARLCLYEAAIDRGEIEAAGRHLDAAVALRSAALLGLADGGDVVDYLRARAEAAVLCAEGRGLEGRQRAVAGLAALERARRRDGGPCREQLEELARGAGALVRPLLMRPLAATLARRQRLRSGDHEHGYADVPSWPLVAWLDIVYLVVFATIIGFVLFYWAVRRFGAGLASMVSYLVPIFALIQAVTILGEAPEPLQIVGGGIILAGVRVATLRFKAETALEEASPA